MDYENKKRIYLIYPDDEPTSEMNCIRYKYSDGLFDWFYAKLKYFGFSTAEWHECVINKELTKKDNSENGCRIRLSDGTYVKFYEVYLMMEFTVAEWREIDKISDNKATMEDVINYYYSVESISCSELNS